MDTGYYLGGTDRQAPREQKRYSIALAGHFLFPEEAVFF